MDELETRVDLASLSVKEALRVRYDHSEQSLIVGERAAKIPPPPAAVSPWVRLVRYMQTLLGIQQELAQTIEVADPAMPLVSLKDVLPDFDPDDVSHIRWAFYYLKLHEPVQNDSPWEQVQGYLEAFEHFYQLQAWLQASELLLKPLDNGVLLHDWLIETGYAPEAILLYQTLLERVNASMDGICWRGLGRAHYWLRDYPAAIAAWQQYLDQRQRTDTTPVLATVYLPLGYAQYVTGDLTGAIATWSYCLPHLPEADIEAVPAAFYLGLAYQAQDQPEPACEHLNQTLPLLREDIALAPQLHQALTAMGEAQQQQGDLAAAIAAWEELLTLQEASEPKPTLLKKLGLAHAALEQYPETIRYLATYGETSVIDATTAELEPELPVLAALGTAYYQTHALNDAIATLQIWADQQESSEFRVQSSKLEDEGYVRENKALETQKNTESEVSKSIHSELTNHSENQDNSERLTLNPAPRDSELYHMLGDAYYQQENYALAQPYLTRYWQATGIDTTPQTLIQLGHCAHMLHDWPQVIKYLEAYQQQAESPPDDLTQVSINYQLGSAYYATEQYAQAIAPLQAYLNHYPEAFPETLAATQFAVGKAAYFSADYTIAIAYLQQYLEPEDAPEAEQALFYLGLAYATQNDAHNTIQIFEQYLTLLGSAAGAQETFQQALFHLGKSYFDLEDYPHALEYFQKYFTLIQETAGVSRGQFTQALNQAGQAYQLCGEYQSAIAHFEELQKLAQHQDNLDLVDVALLHLGEIYLVIGRYGDAQQVFTQALENTQMGNKVATKAKAMGRLGATECAKGNYQKGRSICQKAMRLIRALEDRTEEGLILNTLGTIYCRLGDSDRALSLYQQAWNIARSMDHQRAIAIALGNLGITYGQLGNYTQAIKHLQQSLPIAQALGDRYEMGRILCYLGKNYGLLAEYPDAQDCLDHALQMAQAIQAKPLEAEAHYQVAHLQFAQDLLLEAMDTCEQAIAIAIEGDFPALEDYRAFYGELRPPLWRVVVNTVKRWLGR
ncbi:MAG: tetratricopeptide repeat protein [Spirulina sp. SIO3F2]|nr:tetratricopeptide repeat protein [Spirulina sp. SIO3F2]